MQHTTLDINQILWDNEEDVLVETSVVIAAMPPERRAAVLERVAASVTENLAASRRAIAISSAALQIQHATDDPLEAAFQSWVCFDATLLSTSHVLVSESASRLLVDVNLRVARDTANASANSLTNANE